MDKSQNTMMLVFIAGIVLIAVILVLNQGQTNVVSSDQKNAITVSGNAKMEVEPDQVEVFVRIETFSGQADNAKDENARIADKVIKALKREGIKDDDVETVSFFLNPSYKYDRNKQENILQGYILTNVLKVTSKNIDKAGEIVDTVVDNGANGIQNVNFGLSDSKQKEISGLALEKAAILAKDKAQSLAKSLKVSLGNLVSVQESSFDFITFAAPRADFAMEEAKAAVPTQIEPGNVEISARVTVSYEIR